MAGAVIADTGPLIAFANIDHLEVFKALFNNLVIPQSVWDECCAKSGRDTERIEKAIVAGWIGVRTITNDLKSYLKRNL